MMGGHLPFPAFPLRTGNWSGSGIKISM